MMATPQEAFNLMFEAMLNSEGAHVKDVATVAKGALAVMLKHQITISDEQLLAMPDFWRTAAISLLFDSFMEYALKKLERAKSSAEMN
jgi:predicted SnoaL-like aldol condensation-catalyzing enzyme